MQLIQDYYNNPQVLKKILDSVENPGNRVWTVQDINGKTRTNEKKINTIRKLKELIGKNPNRIYVSVAQFGNPHKVYGKTPKKAQYKIADSLFFGSELLFDLDSEYDLNVAHHDGKEIIWFMKDIPEYELSKISFSGKKGFHILYKDLYPTYEQDPIKRLKAVEERREKLINRLPKIETIDNNHIEIIKDQFRVHAALNTVKAETGFLVKEIPRKDFLYLTTNSIKKRHIHRVVRPTKPMIDEDIIATSKSEKERATLISYPYYYKFIDNMIKGIKERYITVLKYPKDKDVCPMISKIQRKYRLSHFFVFRYNLVDMYINFKVVDKPRLEKIMREAKPMNLNSFLFYGHSWIPITEAVDSNGKKVNDKPELINVIFSRCGLKDAHSRPHARLLNINFNVMAGDKRNKICKAIVNDV